MLLSAAVVAPELHGTVLCSLVVVRTLRTDVCCVAVKHCPYCRECDKSTSASVRRRQPVNVVFVVIVSQKCDENVLDDVAAESLFFQLMFVLR